MFPPNENRNEGTFAKTTLLETALLSPNDPYFGVDKRVVSKRVVSADVPPERKPERGYVRQNHPFTKPPFYLPVSMHRGSLQETARAGHEILSSTEGPLKVDSSAKSQRFSPKSQPCPRW